MDIPGERFTISLGTGTEDVQSSPDPPEFTSSFIKDIVEKSTDTITPFAPILPPNGSPNTGFPRHKKRGQGLSKFRQRAQGGSRGGADTAPSSERTEREMISDANERRIASMSPKEVEQYQKELTEKLSPGLIEMLMKRAELGDGEVHGSFKDFKDKGEVVPKSGPEPVPPEPSGPERRPKLSKRVTFKDADEPPPTAELGDFPYPTNFHFPRPSPDDTDELDPNSPEFLDQLHRKYFPTLPADPSKLAWMAPVSPGEDTAAYHPSHATVAPSALRFDFKGNLLPPRISRELPGHLGLHHHADAPNAAGYTVPELARLARSTFPTQRCMAMQTLGRMLFRLGKKSEEGGYGAEEVVQGLWRCMAEGRVIEGLEEAAAAKGGHISVKAYATDALWLWQKGGGHRWKAE